MKHILPCSLVVALSQAVVFGQLTLPSSPLSKPTPPPTASNSAATMASVGKLPLSFEANQGQTDPRTKFLSRGPGYSLYLTDTSSILAWTKVDGDQPVAKDLHTKTGILRMELVSPNRLLRVSGSDELPGKANYFTGSVAANWRVNIPTYAKVKYSGVYPGVDLVYYGNERQLEYDFVVAPRAEARPIRIHFAGVKSLRLTEGGDLMVGAPHGSIAFHRPVVYQMKNGQQQSVEGRFSLLARNTVGFRIGDYDHSRELVIDPVLAYSTGVPDFGPFLAIDSSGSAYTAAFNGSGILVYKINPAGTALAYSSYIGPASPSAIAVDPDGNAYVAGFNGQAGFPITPGAFQQSCKTKASPCVSGTITKLDPNGSALIFSSYLGGSGGGVDYDNPYNGSNSPDTPTTIAADKEGNAYVGGYAYSADFPVTPGAYQTTLSDCPGGCSNAFVTKINPAGTALAYSSYIGGSGGASVTSIAVDSSGSTYLAGSAGPAFPTTHGAFRTTATLNSGFVSKFNPSGSALVYSTYLGSLSGGGYDYNGLNGLAVDSSGSAYVTGSTSSTDWPVSSTAFQKVNHAASNNSYNMFVTKLNPAGSGLSYSTYLGGSGEPFNIYNNPTGDEANSIAVDSDGNASISGLAASSDFPVTSDAYQKKLASGYPYSIVATKLNSEGSALIYSTYFGGIRNILSNESSAVATDSLENLYFSGYGTGVPFTKDALQPYGTAFLAKFVFNGATTTTVSADVPSPYVGELVTFTAHVEPLSSGATPEETVTFLVDGTVAGNVSVLDGGYALFYSSTLTPGSHSIVASYEGEPGKYSASTGTLTETILDQVATPTFPRLGGTYSLPVPVKIDTATAGAAIHYTVNGSMPTASSPLYTGPVTVFGPTTTVKAIAVRSGNTNSAVGTAVYTILPHALPTTIAIRSLSNPSTLGQPVTFVATVKGESGPTPTGTVIFKHGAKTVGSAPLVDGVATFTIPNLTLLGHSITAAYTGSATNAASAIGLTQEVD
ncbi:Cell surface protein [Acidisarcina polymorpha]|uniref:Cell surface protein n=1 Tax=Acidisarcina polymorpha TaxID=2211140 RepID=A0A2Z5G7K2_9BACT|nr:Ig-like domain repeat protein [Acidisarcina polymorpha]AXC15041.1 Cell surface protein [Acidisarcina polymorpha]